MIRTAIIERSIVTNIVMHDPDGMWQPPEGAILVPSDIANIGDFWNGAEFVVPPTTGERRRAAILAQLEAIDAKSVRPLRAILDAQAAGRTPDSADIARLADYRAQSEALRSGLAS